MARIDKAEARKDMLQSAVESGATHAGEIMGILAGAVRDVAREVGDFATDVFEMREAAQRAAADEPAASAASATRSPDAEPTGPPPSPDGEATTHGSSA
jgi:hypothetical protein